MSIAHVADLLDTATAALIEAQAELAALNNTSARGPHTAVRKAARDLCCGDRIVYGESEATVIATGERARQEAALGVPADCIAVVIEDDAGDRTVFVGEPSLLFDRVLYGFDSEPYEVGA